MHICKNHVELLRCVALRCVALHCITFMRIANKQAAGHGGVHACITGMRAFMRACEYITCTRACEYIITCAKAKSVTRESASRKRTTHTRAVGWREKKRKERNNLVVDGAATVLVRQLELLCFVSV